MKIDYALRCASIAIGRGYKFCDLPFKVRLRINTRNRFLWEWWYGKFWLLPKVKKLEKRIARRECAELLQKEMEDEKC